jgi:hypothetical protein
MGPFSALHATLNTPFIEPANPVFMNPPELHEVVQATFCGT